MLKDAV